MKINREVVPVRAEAADEGELGANAGARRDDDFIEVRIARDDGGGRGFDDVRDVRGGKAASNRGNRGSSESDIANLAKPNQ